MKKKITLSVLFIFAMIMSATFAGNVSAQATAPSFGTASSFSILGASTVTNTGPTVVVGDLGVSPGSAVTGNPSVGGFPPGQMQSGTIHAADAVASQAQSGATIAYNNLAGQPCSNNLTGQDLGGLTLTTGVYCFDSSAQLTGTLTLNAQGNPNAVFIFQMGSTITTASNSSVVMINGANACNVFFQVGSSATLGTNTSFQGNILALTSITLTTNVNVIGKVFALNGAVTMDSNHINSCSAPTAAGVTIGGRVLTSFGRGLSRARVNITAADGTTRTVLTNPFGYYSFSDVEAGQSAILSVFSKRYFYRPLVITVTDDLSDFNFTPAR